MTQMTFPNQSHLRSNAFSRLWRGVSSNTLTQILAALSAILLVPLFLGAWGADGYGRWISLTALVSYLALLDLGGQSFIGNVLTRAYSRGDEAEFRQRLSEGVSFFFFIALFVSLSLAGVLLVPGLRLPGQPATLTIEERAILLCVAMPILIGVPGGVLVTAYRATGRFVRGQMVGNTMRGLGLIASAVALLVRASPLAYSAVILANAILLTILVVWDIRRQVPVCREMHLSYSFAKAGRSHLKGSLYFWLLALAYALQFQGVILIVNASASSETVTLFATHRTAAGLVGYIGLLIQAPLWPELTFLHAQGRHSDLGRVALLAVKAISLASACAALALWLLMPVVYPIWTGGEVPYRPGLLFLLLLQAVLAAGWSTSGWMLLATNQHRQIAEWAIANAAITLGLAWLLAPRYGVMGVAAAGLVGDVMCGLLVYPHLAASALQVASGDVYRAMVRPVLLFLFAVPLTAFAVSQKNLGAVLLLILALCFVIYLTARSTFTAFEWGWILHRVSWPFVRRSHSK